MSCGTASEYNVFDEPAKEEEEPHEEADDGIDETDAAYPQLGSGSDISVQEEE